MLTGVISPERCRPRALSTTRAAPRGSGSRHFGCGGTDLVSRRPNRQAAGRRSRREYKKPAGGEGGGEPSAEEPASRFNIPSRGGESKRDQRSLPRPVFLPVQNAARRRRQLLGYGLTLANDGELDGKRYLSRAAMDELRKEQTGATEVNYSPRYHLRNGMFGDDGAYGTDLSVDPKTGMVVIFMVQSSGGDQWSAHDLFL
jgi:CubicO group peptidase (beta-lactamase class C family)